MQPTSVVWRDLTFATGTEEPYRISSVEGWESLPPSRFDKQPRSRSHGSHSSPVWSDERVVTVEGFSRSGEERDAVFAALGAGFTYDGGEETLTISMAGRTLTAAAQLVRYDPIQVRGEWGVGTFGWLAQWRCPDPLRYGLPQDSVSTGLPVSGGGMVFPMVFPMDFGPAGDPGQVTLVNDGTAAASILMTVTGSLPSGFEVSSDGQRLRYETEVPSGETLTIDTGEGTVVAEGTADRRGNLTIADWIQVPKQSSLTLQFTSLGGAFDAAATLTVPAFRSASW